jgi:hypothetical protein
MKNGAPRWRVSLLFHRSENWRKILGVKRKEMETLFLSEEKKSQQRARAAKSREEDAHNM